MTPHGLLTARQDLWEYGTRWLSLRRKVADPNRSRWPEVAAWTALRRARMGAPACGLIREHVSETSVTRLTASLIGYLASFAVVAGADDLDGALEALPGAASRYLDGRATTFERMVERKRRAWVAK